LGWSDFRLFLKAVGAANFLLAGWRSSAADLEESKVETREKVVAVAGVNPLEIGEVEGVDKDLLTASATAPAILSMSSLDP
jgi:hypothetical protein